MLIIAKPGVVFISFAICLSLPRIPLYFKKYFAALTTNSVSVFVSVFVFVFVFIQHIMQDLIYCVKYYLISQLIH